MMSVSKMFEFSALQLELPVERVEIEMAEFGALRRHLAGMVMVLRESEETDASEFSGELRILLSGWLTAPVSFAPLSVQLQSLAGPATIVRNRWGFHIGSLYASAIAAADELADKESPLCEKLREILKQVDSENTTHRIYCNNIALHHFHLLAPTASYINTPAQYRASDFFDVLIKIGPLRSRGWGAVPHAVISAPRYRKLMQLVWAGGADEPGFGYDPVDALSSAGFTGIRNSRTVPVVTRTFYGTLWGSGVEALQQLDELQVFSSLAPTAEGRKATLVQLDHETGILYPPLSRVLSFDPDPDPDPASRLQLERRLVDGGLSIGMFVVRYINHNAAGMDVLAQHGQFSPTWKAQLEKEISKDRKALCYRLRRAGVGLESLEDAVDQWCRSPTTVIHAPKKRAHFFALIKELRIDTNVTRFSQRAWREITASRGEAITAGVLEHEAADKWLHQKLEKLIDEIRRHVTTECGHFTVALDAEDGTGGTANFYRIESIEDGFMAPDRELKIVSELEEIEQWRV